MAAVAFQAVVAGILQPVERHKLALVKQFVAVALQEAAHTYQKVQLRGVPILTQIVYWLLRVSLARPMRKTTQSIAMSIGQAKIIWLIAANHLW